jgi:Ca2+-binding EF-hand superfamily protein
MGRGMMRPAMLRVLMVMLDTDGDGALSLEEIQAVHQRMFKAIDADNNGRLTVEEIQRFMRGE